MKQSNPTDELSGLLSVPYLLRDADWRLRFKAAIVTASLRAAEPAAFHGPDGFPCVTLKPGGLPSNPMFVTVAKSAVNEIAGLALFADDQATQEPAFVFTHGDLVAYTN